MTSAQDADPHEETPRDKRRHMNARNVGSRFERDIADYLAQQLNDDRIDRRVPTGARDCGDIAGVRAHDAQRIVIECKYHTRRPNLPGWVAEAATEADNDDALVGVLVHKRAGVTAPGAQWVTMTVDDLLACLYGRRYGARAGVPGLTGTVLDGPVTVQTNDSSEPTQ